MRRTAFAAVLLALVPALALAAPKRKARSKSKKKAPAKVEPAAKEPAPTPDAPDEEPPAPATPAPASDAATPTAPAPTGGAAAPQVAPKVPTPASSDDDPERTEGPDVDALRQDYLKLRDELFQSRARASTVASELYSTRIQVKLTYTSGRFYNPAKSVVRLDGATVFEDASGAIAGNDNLRFEGYVAPGRHVLTFRVEATGKDDDTFTSVTETQVVVKAVPGKDLVVAAKARDGGNIAYEWKKSEQGNYGLGIDVAVKTAARAKGDK